MASEERRFVDGWWLDDFRGAPRAYVYVSTPHQLGFGARLNVLPATATVSLVWGNGLYPARTGRFMESQLASALGLPGPRASSPSGLESVGAPTDLAAWAGRYRNGQLLFVLKAEGDRLLYFDGINDLEVGPLRGSVLAVRIPDGRVALTFRLREAGGNRFVLLGDKAYVWEGPAL